LMLVIFSFPYLLLYRRGSTSTSSHSPVNVYLGTYATEDEAARAHDCAVLKFYGSGSKETLNFEEKEYSKELEIMQTMDTEEYVAFLRRSSTDFSRGQSKYFGVSRYRIVIREGWSLN
ncbi:hypothetical protein GOP47_0015385, partial [Adiantum capillus-veneris]